MGNKADTLDSDDDIELDITGGEDDDDAELRKIITKALGDDDGDDDDLYGDFKEPDANKTVSVEEGLDLIDKASTKQRKADAEPDTPAKEEGEEPEAGEEGKEGEAKETPAPDIDALLEGLPDDRKAAVAQRITESDGILDLFKDHAEELKLHGTDAKAVMTRLLDINQFAQTKPDEYIAWAAQQIGGDDPSAILGKAAERLGFRLVKAEADDDPFEDEEIKQLREENRRLKGKGSPDFGPDAPQHRAARDLESFVSAKDPATGQLLRPDWPYVEAEIGREAQRILGETGKAVTIDQVAELYTAASAKLRGLVAPQPPTPAAQGGKPVADKKPNDAAAIEKSQRASKSIDGAGQGAGRRPALSDEADLTETIRHFATRS